MLTESGSEVVLRGCPKEGTDHSLTPPLQMQGQRKAWLENEERERKVVASQIIPKVLMEEQGFQETFTR